MVVGGEGTVCGYVYAHVCARDELTEQYWCSHRLHQFQPQTQLHPPAGECWGGGGGRGGGGGGGCMRGWGECESVHMRGEKCACASM